MHDFSRDMRNKIIALKMKDSMFYYKNAIVVAMVQLHINLFKPPPDVAARLPRKPDIARISW